MSDATHGREHTAGGLLDRVSSESLRGATGRDWREWLVLLDSAGAAQWDHGQTVGHLEREHPEVSSWWRQTLAVGYEQARGKRVVGQTADAGFQVGVQRSVPATAARLWNLIVSRPDLWLGGGADVDFVRGARYAVPGARGEIRVVKPGDRLRMTWQPDGWASPATLQLALQTRPSGKTAITVHLERLPDAEAREEMRGRWRRALEQIVAAAS